MKSKSLRTLVQTGIITSISNLRINESGYPFVTVLQGSKAQNIYFGKNSAARILSNYQPGDNVIAELKNADVIFAINENNEERFKLSIPSVETGYASKSELMEAFGGVVEDFEDSKFNALFTAKPETAPVAQGFQKPVVKKTVKAEA